MVEIFERVEDSGNFVSYRMIGLFAVCVQNLVALNHVVNNVALGNFLRSELFGR